MAQRLSGRLELTWTNKDLRLLAHEDGSYEWVPPADYRVAEVRLMHDAGSVGETSSERMRAKDNLLIRGDAFSALHSLVQLPEFSKQLVGEVRLAYLDPPFNTQQAFAHYDDALEHSVWLTMMRDRLLQIKQLLSPDGSIWVHCDDSEQAYLKVMMDELFGRENFIATVVWQKVTGRENRTHIGSNHDYIVIYAMQGRNWMKVRNLLPYGNEQLARYANPDDDPRGLWASDNLTAQAGRGTSDQFYELKTPNGRIVTLPPGRCWLVTERRLAQLIDDKRIWFGDDGGNVPRLKRFLDETQGGLVPTSWWPHVEVGSNDEAKKELKQLFKGVEPFGTPKPERLMERIVHIATNPGDIVLDCFAGSGTTAAVAHKMGRRWITSEWSADTVETFTLPRLEKVVGGEDPGGITDAADWKGGGGFRVLNVAPSMFEEDEGLVVLADWATQSALSEATAAQLGFAYVEDQPFVGRKGKMRLAVIDGLVSQAVVELLLSALPDGERLTICGTTIDDEAAEFLRGRRRGSRIRKIPASILVEYEQTNRWRPPLASNAPEPEPIADEDVTRKGSAKEAPAAKTARRKKAGAVS